MLTLDGHRILVAQVVVEYPKKHATKHSHHAREPLIQSFEPGEVCGWCYIGQVFFERAPLQVARR